MAKPTPKVDNKKIAPASKAVSRKETTALAVAPVGNWGTEKMNKKNVIISRIQLCQPMSIVVVTDEVADAGDLIDSVTKEVLAGKGESLEIIPFYTFDNWLNKRYDEDKEEFVFDSVEDFTPSNAARKYKSEVDGVAFEHDHQINFMVLIVDKLEANPTAWPLLLTFRRTSQKAGRKLVSAITQKQGLNQSIASMIYSLTTKKEQNKEGKPYFVLDVAPSRDTPAALLNIAYQWYVSMYKEQSVEVEIASDDYEESLKAEEANSKPARKSGEVRSSDQY